MALGVQGRSAVAWLTGALVLALVCRSSALGVEFLTLTGSSAVLAGSLPQGNDVFSDTIPITLPSGFPFSNHTETTIHVSVDGFLSFRTGRDYCCPEKFNPTSPYTHLIAPYWINNDITDNGEVAYEVHVNGSLLDHVSSVVSGEVGGAFDGVWMIVVHWNNVPSHSDSSQINSYQAVVVTDGNRSYALFLYRCGFLATGGAGIGYRASGNFFENHPLSGLPLSQDIACLNAPQSDWTTVVYQIHHDGVRATIRSNPKGPVFQAGRYIDLRCYVVTPGNYTFSWETVCSEGGSEQLVTVHSGFTDVDDLLSVRTTPLECLDVVVCRVVDDVGSEGEGRFRISNVTGVGVYHRINTMANNTGLEADSQHRLGVVTCHSASRAPHIGRWTTPSGHALPLAGNEVFSVELRSGNFPSYTVLSLRPGAVFSEEYEGVYSCLIPDENGEEQTVHFGLYSSGYSSTPFNFPLTMTQTSFHPFTLTCTSTYLPPYLLQWRRNTTLVTDDDRYSLSSVLRDRQSSTYDSSLSLLSEDLLEPDRMTFSCGVLMQVQPYHENERPSLQRFVYFTYAGVNRVGTLSEVKCTAKASATRAVWMTGGSEVSRNNTGNEVTFILNPVSDSHHGNEYVCMGYSGSALIYQLHFTIFVQVPQSALTVSVATEPSTQPVIGQPFTLLCLATQFLGLTNHASLRWSHDLSHDSSSDVIDPDECGVVQLPTLTSCDLSFSELRASHAGRYSCTAALASEALEEPLVQSVSHELELTIPMATVELTTPQSVSTFHAGSDITLTCTATLSQSVDVEVTGVVTWDTPHGMLNESMERFTLSTVRTGSHAHQFMLHISPLSHVSDEGDYGCRVIFKPSSPSLYLSPSPLSDSSNTIHLSLNGVVLYHPSHGYLQNNSILTASSDGHINRLQCISDTTTPLVQEWVTPSRHPTLNITHGNGVAPGVIELGLLDGGVFTADLQGVYTCVVDDVSGRVHQLSVGLFPHAFSDGIQVERVSVSEMVSGVFAVECVTSSSPPLTVVWMKDGQPLSNTSTGLNFTATQQVVDRGGSVYSSLLAVVGPLPLALGNYHCTAGNMYGSVSMETTVRGVAMVPSHEGGVFTLGRAGSVLCSSDLSGAEVNWRSSISDDVIVSGNELQFAVVSESVNGREYVCHVTTQYGSLEEEYRVIVEADADDFTLTVTDSSVDQSVGQELSLYCTFTTPNGTLGVPVVVWKYGNGTVVPGTTVSERDREIISVLKFPSLSLNDRGSYICTASVSLTVSPFQISKSRSSSINPVTPPPTDDRTTTATPTSANPDPAAATNEGGVVSAIVVIVVVVIAVIVIAIVAAYCALKRKKNIQSYNTNGSYPQEPFYEYPPPPYTTSPVSPLSPLSPPHTHTHTQLQLQENGHTQYAMVGNGTYSQVSVGNIGCSGPPPPLPPARNSTLDPEFILPYADTGTNIRAEQTTDTHGPFKGQSADRTETANPLYASTENLEPIYTKVDDMESRHEQS